MQQLIRSNERGLAEHGWLTSRHTFSFADYYNPAMMGFGDLRVVNEDVVKPGQGFGTHPHRDMEIISYVIDGELEHKDSMGNGSVIRAGDVQRMTAGTGVFHSEFNHSQDRPVHFLQIWILPEATGLEPGYEQKFFARDDKLNRLRLLASRDGRDESIRVNQDVALYGTVLDAGGDVSYEFDDDRQGFVQLVSGSAVVNGETLIAGDALMLRDTEILSVQTIEEAELLLFDMTSG